MKALLLPEKVYQDCEKRVISKKRMLDSKLVSKGTVFGFLDNV